MAGPLRCVLATRELSGVVKVNTSPGAPAEVVRRSRGEANPGGSHVETLCGSHLAAILAKSVEVSVEVSLYSAASRLLAAGTMKGMVVSAAPQISAALRQVQQPSPHRARACLVKASPLSEAAAESWKSSPRTEDPLWRHDVWQHSGQQSGPLQPVWGRAVVATTDLLTTALRQVEAPEPQLSLPALFAQVSHSLPEVE